MNEFEKLYTVEDVAKMTGMTDRTIRNYLKDGKLKGRKIVGQWRFTRAEVEALMGIGDGTAREEKSRDLLENACENNNPDVAAVAELICERGFADDIAARIQSESGDKANGFDDTCTFAYDYADGRARFTLRGSVDYVGYMLKVIKKMNKKSREL